jgi:predicted O-linked N-acetylglucosamine transferase (SPINDLY family)
MLASLDLPELVAADDPSYLTTAVTLARDRDRLEAMRTGLRERFWSSPLADYDRFARDLEGAFRGMWRAWVAA